MLGSVWGLVVAALCVALNGFFVAAEFALVKVRATQLRSRARRGVKKAIVAESIVGRLDRYPVRHAVRDHAGKPRAGVDRQIAAMAAVLGSAVGSRLGSSESTAVHAAVTAIAFAILTFGHVLLRGARAQASSHPAVRGDSRSPPRSRFASSTIRSFPHPLAARTDIRPDSRPRRAVPGRRQRRGRFEARTQDHTSPSWRRQRRALSRAVVRCPSSSRARDAVLPARGTPFDGSPGRRRVASHQTSGADGLEFVRRESVFADPAHERPLSRRGGRLSLCERLPARPRRTVPVGSRFAPQGRPSSCPEVQNSVDVLREMQRKQVPMAVVVDEYGGTSGLVTHGGPARGDRRRDPRRVRSGAATRGPSSRARRRHGFHVDGRAAMEELRAIGVQVPEAEARRVRRGLRRRAPPGACPAPGTRCSSRVARSLEVTGISRRRVTCRPRAPEGRRKRERRRAIEGTRAPVAWSTSRGDAPLGLLAPAQPRT